MARVRDLWHTTVKGPDGKPVKRKTARHPDLGGNKDAKRWLALWIAPDGREESKAFRAKDPARKHAQKMQEDVERDEYVAPAAGRELFGPLAGKWMRLRKLGGGSAVRYESVNRLHVEPWFGERQVRSVRPSEVLEWLVNLAKTHGPSTQEIAFHIVQGTFDLAVADGMRKDNPARSPIIPRIANDPKERDPWTTEKVWSVIDQHPTPYRAVPILGAGCGLRQGEAFAVTVDDLDFENGKLEIRRQIARVGNLIVFKLPKGGKTRTAPLSPGVAQAVQAHIRSHPPVETTLPWMTEDGELAEDKVTVRLLFVWRGQLFVPPLAEGARTRSNRGLQKTAEGLNLRTSVYNTLVWKVALARAGVIPPPTNDERGALLFEEAREEGMHALRHFFSTTLQDAGVNLAGVMDFMGHSRKGSRLPVTLGVYGHVTEETFEAARNAIDRSLFRLRAVQDHTASGTEAEQAVSL
ncbi:tyrosine-type recombinase/integrase [Nonomuraea sp. NPDC050451]|uniref:tyrosine-type recombinase/integrase n=1 Tax=Nonomuraea sp. NPDC050451 TaxID=3364364 RepID=UPI0037BA22A1